MEKVAGFLFSDKWKDKIKDYDSLPKIIKKLIGLAKNIETKSFKELVGLDGRSVMWDAFGYRINNKFVVEKIEGFMDGLNIRWDANKGFSYV